MSNNNYNQKSSVPVIIITAAVTLAFGYFLFRSSPQNNINQTASVDDMHGGSSATPTNEQLDSLVGKTVPDFQLSDKEGKKYGIAEFRGKNIILFFNEGLMCYPACWNQIAAFGSDERFNNDQNQAISVEVDSASDWRQAVAKMPQLAKANTMFDVNAEASAKLGMLITASSMHRGSLPGHTYLLIDKEGIVRYVLDDPNMAIANDALFNKIKELNN